MFHEIPQTLDALQSSATAPLDVLQNLPAEDQPEAIFASLIQQLSQDFEFIMAISSDESFPTPFRLTVFKSLLTFFENAKTSFPQQTSSLYPKLAQNGLNWIRSLAYGQTQLELQNDDPIFDGYILERTPRHALAPEQIIFTADPKKGALVNEPYVTGAIAFLGDGKTTLYFHSPAFDFLGEFDREGNFIPKSSENYVPLYWEDETFGYLNTNGLFYDRTLASRKGPQILTPPEQN